MQQPLRISIIFQCQQGNAPPLTICQDCLGPFQRNTPDSGQILLGKAAILLLPQLVKLKRGIVGQDFHQPVTARGKAKRKPKPIEEIVSFHDAQLLMRAHSP